MSRSDRERLTDLLDALERCLRYRSHLDSTDNIVSDMAIDATLRNLAVAGEAAEALSVQTRAAFVDVPWHSIAGLRNVLVHEYFRIDTAVVIDIVDAELAPLTQAIRTYLDRSPAD